MTSLPKNSSGKDPKPLQYATKAIKSVGEDCFVFHCVARFETYKINRNMIVLKSPDGNLTVINPILLTESGEKSLLKLGKIQNIVRLGTSVNFYDGAVVEDAYYLSKFPKCQRWAPGKLASCPSLPIHQKLQHGMTMPHPDCRCFVIQSTAQPEAVLLLQRETGGNMLITGDCLQHQMDNSFVNTPAYVHLKVSGYMKNRVVISKKWLEAMQTPEEDNAKAIRSSMEVMTKTKFHRFISTSGNVMLKVEARQGVVDAIEKAFVAVA
ncbi:expressed unknown protein [Seminavis robusta]|uniref:Uncharacterized protein n=1 Tax=Seminavis robusta TaxID=568900 RepID=A0A9N8ED36_9STRA|nr:expressed unknown protein [Seminavis robusta]|eukprot:Sro774_g200670.1 n/a (266) ;mRNA; r:28496-29293